MEIDGRLFCKNKLADERIRQGVTMTLLEQEQRNLVDSVELGIMLGKSRDNVLRLCKQGKLPRPVKPVHRNMRWLASDIETWLSLGCPSQATFERWKGEKNGA
ncbi:hypothetical protein ES705_21263 [subsurface metagenome]